MAQKRKPHSAAKEGKAPKVEEESIDIPEDEQWRLINDSGVLNKVPTPADTHKAEAEEPIELVEEIFNAVLLIVPFTFCLVLMEILIHFQYRQHPTFTDVKNRLLSGFPILSLFIFYTTRYKTYRSMQLLLLITGVLCGARLVYLINIGSWLTNMQQCPPLATVWIYTSVQLDLAPSVLNLVFVGIYVWVKGLKIFP